MIQSLKEYLTALNNSFDQSVDSATARTAPGRDDIDDDEFSSGPVDSMTQVQLISEPLGIEDSQMDSTLPVYNDLVHGRETEDTQDQQGGEVMSCTLYPRYSMDDLFDHIRLFIADPCVCDCEGLSFPICPQRRDLSKDLYEYTQCHSKTEGTKIVCWDKVWFVMHHSILYSQGVMCSYSSKHSCE